MTAGTASVAKSLPVTPVNGSAFRDPAFMANRDAPVHRWVPWIAGYSKHFVEDALTRFTAGSSVVLDPFAGVGTTLIEADLAGHEAVGFEINPYAVFAAQTKLKAHRVDPDYLRSSVGRFGVFMEQGERRGTKPRTAPPAAFRTRAPFYSPKVEQKVLLGSRVTGALRYDAAFVAGRRRRTRSKLAQGLRSLARVSASFGRGQA